MADLDDKTIADEIDTMREALETGQAMTLDQEEEDDGGVVSEPLETDTMDEGGDEVSDTITDPPLEDTEDEVEDVEEEEEIKTDAPSTEPPVDPEIERLRGELEELKSRLKEGDEEEEDETVVTDPPIEDVRFVDGDEDLADVLGSAEELNKLLNQVYKKGLLDAQSRTREVVATVPAAIKAEQNERDKMVKQTNKFYDENPDLVEWKGTVGAVFNELHLQDPNKTEEQIMSELAGEVRKRAGLEGKLTQDSAPENEDDKEKPPPLPKKKGQRRQPAEPQLTGMEAEIDAMNKQLQY